jgi:tetratricopeptide (TPR) repeat protein
MSKAKQNSSARTESIWLYRPSLDLIVGCGAWSLPLLMVAYFYSASSTLAWSVVFYGLALFFNYPHYMATIYRAYHTREDFNKYRIFTVHVTFLIVLTVILSHVWVQILPWIFTIYLTASPWHYSGQNYGLFMMFARRAGAQPTNGERRAIYSAFLISYAILFLNFHTGRSADSLFLSLNLPGAVSSWLQIVLGIAFVACSAYGLWRFIAQAGFRRMVPSLTLFSTQCVWFLLPTLLQLVEKFQVPQGRYSTGVLAVMHSAQYLWITSYYAKREASASESRAWRPFAYFAVLVVGGIALFIPGPWLSSVVFHFDFTRSFLIFTALVNIHHFILDGAIWKLRDGRIAALLVNSKAQLSQSASDAKDKTAVALRWIVGQSSGARLARISVALVLLVLGSVDQFHYYLALHSYNLSYLKQAAALMPYDAPLQTHLAHAALEEGKIKDSVAAWGYAIEANPLDPAPRDAFLQYLTQTKELNEAYQRTGTWLKLAPKDVSLLMNHGILAQQFGQTDEAERSWQKALELDPSQAYADLYLATILDQQGKLDPAILHYEAFLAKLAQQQDANHPPAATLITVVLKLADCDVRANHPDKALQFYKMAQTLAAQTQEKRLESFASIAEASLLTKSGQTGDALPLYQKALQLDAAVQDNHSQAIDWYSYAMFLRQAGYPANLVYAGLLKSQELFPPNASDAEVSAAAKARKELEQQLGPQAAGIRRNFGLLVSEALQLKR